jgi:periplasmic protein TonB
MSQGRSQTGSRGGFLEQRTSSPGSLTIVVALHAAGIAGLMAWKTDFVPNTVKPLIVDMIEQAPPPPPEKPVPQVKPEVRQKAVIDQVPPVIRTERPTEFTLERAPDIKPVFDPGPIGNVIADPAPITVPDPPKPVPEPVRKEATMLPSSELQPPYPASEQRAENEGSVTVRILIGTDGRVKSVEKVRGASEAFFRATEQQALRHWRFRPATVDGRPVESRKIMTVHFRLMA